MLTIGIVAVVFVLYYFGWYNAALVVIAFAIFNGLLGAARAVLNPEWYASSAHAAGTEPNYIMLFTMKGAAVVILLAAAWFVSQAAGYI